ncbi:MAG: hypothetical protein QM661_06630 [Solimonas sp.]
MMRVNVARCAPMMCSAGSRPADAVPCRVWISLFEHGDFREFSGIDSFVEMNRPVSAGRHCFCVNGGVNF